MALAAATSESIGAAVECQHVDAASGDTVQQTSTGKAYIRRGTSTPIFSDGAENWALIGGKVLTWTGASPGAASGNSFGRLQGVWERRDAYLVFLDDGTAQNHYRRVAGDDIVFLPETYTGLIKMEFAEPLPGEPLTAQGTVTSTTDADLLALGPVTIIYVAADAVALQHAGNNPLWFCRPSEDRDLNACGP